MKAYRYRIPLKGMGLREGVLFEENERWTEASPLPGWSKESINDVLALNEVASLQFSKSSTLPHPRSIPLCGLIMGDIETHAKFLRNNGYTHAKVKVGHLSLKETLPLLKDLQKDFRLRIDFNRKWSAKDCYSLLSSLDFEYAEEPSDFSFPYALDESFRDGREANLVIHKPTLNPERPKIPFVLSSAFESSIGLAHIAAIPGSHEPMGLDTWRYFEEDILEEPLYVKKGRLHFPEKLQPRMDLLVRCI